MRKIIEVKDVSKIYYQKRRKGFFKREKTEINALKNINLTVEKGEIFSLLGPNGAGKTTLIKILTTLLLPTSGNILILGMDIEKEGYKVRSLINAMLMGERSIYWKLTGRQNLEYFASLYHIRRSDAKKRINKLIAEIDIEEFIDRKVETYSSGQKFKVAFAKSLINNPPLIFLDEPTSTLDPRAAIEVRRIIKTLNENGTTIFLTTHNMHEADELSDRVAILDLGEIIDVDSSDKLKESISTEESLKIEIPSSYINGKEWIKDLGTLSFVDDIAFDQKVNGYGEGERSVIKVVSKEHINLNEVTNLFEIHEIPILSINTEKVSLEDVFLKKTGRLLSEDTVIGE